MQQPWLKPAGTPPPRGVPDDFSPASVTWPLGRVILVLGLTMLLLLAGRSEAMLDAAYGLPILPGTEAAIAAAEAWNETMTALGLPQTMRALRDALSLGR